MDHPGDLSLGSVQAVSGSTRMLSVDQFLRLISVPAVVAAFLIASQISGGGIFNAAQAQISDR